MAMRKAVEEGKTISEPLAETKVFPPMVVQMINVGEQTGALDQMLSKIADFYEEEVDTAVPGLMKLIEPLLIAFLGGVIGTIVTAMYMPMYTIIRSTSEARARASAPAAARRPDREPHGRRDQEASLADRHPPGGDHQRRGAVTSLRALSPERGPRATSRSSRSPAGVTYALCLVYLVLAALAAPAGPAIQAGVQLVGDISIVTGLVYYFGGAASSFSTLYLVVITVAATLLRSGAAIVPRQPGLDLLRRPRRSGCAPGRRARDARRRAASSRRSSATTWSSI